MRFRTKLFITWGGLAPLLWLGSFWPVHRTILSSFDHFANESFAGTRQSLHTLQAERVNQIGKDAAMVMNDTGLRALIAETREELSTENLKSLHERLDFLAQMMSVPCVFVLDSRGHLIAQNAQSPWKTLEQLNSYLVDVPQAYALLSRLYGAASANPSAKTSSVGSEYGLWAADGQLYQVVGVPLRFGAGSNNEVAEVDGLLMMAAPLTDAMAGELAESHLCQVTFTAGSQIVASSLPLPSRRQLSVDLQHGQWLASDQPRMDLLGTPYRSTFEPLIDPESQTQVGGMLIQSSLQSALSIQSAAWRTLALIGAAGLLAAALGSFLLSTAVTRPVGTLVAAVRRVAAGDLSVAIGSASRDDLGELARAFDDMVVQVRSRRELQRLVDESRAASQAKSQFLANMSHEIRTPLHGVIGMAELLQATRLNDVQRRYVGLARTSAEILGSLINDILDFSKIEAGKLELESIDFDLHTIAEDAAELLAHKASAKKLELACDISPNVPAFVHGDPNRLRQVLINLLNNAIKFTAAGSVVIRISRQDGQDPLALRFAVTDTGIGIPLERRNRLFQPFTQVDASTTRKYGGTGLGLAICKQLVELMGGVIGVDSQHEQGSTFWFNLTLQPSQNSADPVQTPRLDGLNVLVAGKTSATQDMICRRLSADGAVTHVTPDLDNAAQMAHAAQNRGQPLNSIIMDISNTGIDEAALRKTLSGNPDLAEVTLVLLSTSEPQDDAPANDQIMRLVKPIRYGQMRDALAKLRAMSHPGQSTADVNANSARAGVQTARAPFRILLAEDNEVNQIVATELLAAAGYVCEAVGDGAAAVQAAKSGRFHLVLMDCQMPIMDGLEAVRLIRQHEAASRAGNPNRRLPIIALTANASGIDRDRCMEAGMDGYCGKPFEPRKLLQAIDALLADAVPPQASPVPTANPDIRPEPKREELSLNAALIAAPDNPASKPPIRLAGLIERCSGNRTLAETVLLKFEKQLADAMGQIRTCIATNDAPQLARASHALKGTAGIVAADALSQIAQRLEQAGRNHDFNGIEEQLSQLNAEIIRCSAFIAQNANNAKAEM